jgi:hypothetical protein
MADDRYANGPVIATIPPPRPPLRESVPLPERPTWQQLAYAYSTETIEARAHRQAVYAELDEMRAGIVLLDLRFGALSEKIRDDLREMVSNNIRQIVREELINRPASMRNRLPSLREYNPDLTPGNGIRLEGPEWERLQEDVEELRRRQEEADQKARDAQLKQQGAEEYAAALVRRAEVSDRRANKRLLKAVIGAIAAAGALATAITHLWHVLSGH